MPKHIQIKGTANIVNGVCKGIYVEVLSQSHYGEEFNSFEWTTFGNGSATRMFPHFDSGVVLVSHMYAPAGSMEPFRGTIFKLNLVVRFKDNPDSDSTRTCVDINTYNNIKAAVLAYNEYHKDK